MKNECAIVRDLLFSYSDGVLSMTSKKLVEEHLTTCESCRKILEEIKQDEEKKSQIKEIDYLKFVKKKMNKKNVALFISILILLLLISFHILVYHRYNEIASTMDIYLQDDITKEEYEAIKNKILEQNNSIEMKYVSKESSLEKLKENLGERANLLDGYQEQNNPLYAFIEIKADTSTEIQTIAEAIQSMPGVISIRTYQNYNPYGLFLFGITDQIK